MKRRNPSWGSPRIAQQIALAFGVAIDKDVVRRVLRVHLPAGIDAVETKSFSPTQTSFENFRNRRCTSRSSGSYHTDSVALLNFWGQQAGATEVAWSMGT
jgi:hypothetical protein